MSEVSRYKAFEQHYAVSGMQYTHKKLQMHRAFVRKSKICTEFSHNVFKTVT